MTESQQQSQHQKELHARLWEMANDLRGNMEAYEFKNYILGMIFYRYLSDKTTAFVEKLLEEDEVDYRGAFNDEEYLHGFKGISIMAKVCIYLFFGLLIFVLLVGGQGRFIIENGFQSLGKMTQNFIELATYTDPARTNNFPQDWTIYYWAYWMVWCIVAPFFIGNISKGRTIKQTILGGYVFGVGSTSVSFIVLGNYSLGLQLKGTADFIAQYETSGDLYDLIISMINTIPCANFVLILTMICMITFYATSFDSIAYTAACYSYKELKEGEKPHNLVSLLWCLLLIVLPIALVFSESSMRNIQSISIISAFPIGLIMIAMILGLFRDMKKYLKEREVPDR